MESTTYLKNLKISPKKLRLLLPAVKRLAPVEVAEHLIYLPQKSAKILMDAIQSAIANAKNVLNVSADMLEFKTLLVEEGQKLRRYRPHARGTVRPILKRFSHLKIVLKVKNVSSKDTDNKSVSLKQTSETKKQTKTKTRSDESSSSKKPARKMSQDKEYKKHRN